MINQTVCHIEVISQLVFNLVKGRFFHHLIFFILKRKVRIMSRMFKHVFYWVLNQDISNQ